MAMKMRSPHHACSPASAGSPSRPSRAFVLLEVTLAVVILGISSAVFMRSFVLSMHSIRRMDISMKASLLAQAKLNSFDLFPPEEGKKEGAFADDPDYGEVFKFYFWILEAEEKEIDYDDVDTEGARRELFPLTQVRLQILYNDGVNRRYVPIDVTTYLTGLDPFSYQTRQTTQYF
jgi:type II secretory pathway pseudopilin PulG